MTVTDDLQKQTINTTKQFNRIYIFIQPTIF